MGRDGNGNGLEGRRDGRVGRRAREHSTTLAHSRLHVSWDSMDTIILRLGVLLLCVPTAMFNLRFFLYINCTIFYWIYWGCIYDSRTEMGMHVFLLGLHGI